MRKRIARAKVGSARGSARASVFSHANSETISRIHIPRLEFGLGLKLGLGLEKGIGLKLQLGL